jgi:hypothetical protein
MNSHIHKEDFPTRFDTASRVADIVGLFPSTGDIDSTTFMSSPLVARFFTGSLLTVARFFKGSLLTVALFFMCPLLTVARIFMGSLLTVARFLKGSLLTVASSSCVHF